MILYIGKLRDLAFSFFFAYRINNQTDEEK